MVPDLRGPRARLARAKEGLDNLTARVDAFIDDEPYRIDVEPADGPPGAVKATLQVLKELPTDWELDVSEIGHHVRAALDNLVFQLALANRPEADQGRTQFPIFKDALDYTMRRGKRPSHRASMLEGVSNGDRNIIDGLQPYQAGAQQAEQHPLWLLKRISDRDKHQVPHAALAVVGQPYAELTSRVMPNQTIRLNFPPRVAEDGAELFQIAPDASTGSEIGDIHADVVLVFGPYHVDVDDLDRLIQKVARIIDRFDRP